VQINSRFVYLSAVSCPKTFGVQIDNCFNHEGTYFGEISVTTIAGDHLHIVAGRGRHGFKNVTLNGQVIVTGSSSGLLGSTEHKHQRNHSDGDHPSRKSIYVKRNTYRSLVVYAGVYEIVIENSDKYLDIVRVDVACWSCLVDDLQPEGLLGRTWNQKVDVNSTDSEIMNYEEKGDSLTGCQFEKQKFCSTQPKQQSME